MADRIRIIITGASSGLGMALARAYARKYRQNAVLGLCGRNQQALDALAAELASDYQSVSALWWT